MTRWMNRFLFLCGLSLVLGGSPAFAGSACYNIPAEKFLCVSGGCTATDYVTWRAGGGTGSNAFPVRGFPATGAPTMIASLNYPRTHTTANANFSVRPSFITKTALATENVCFSFGLVAIPTANTFGTNIGNVAGTEGTEINGGGAAKTASAFDTVFVSGLATLGAYDISTPAACTNSSCLNAPMIFYASRINDNDLGYCAVPSNDEIAITSIQLCWDTD